MLGEVAHIVAQKLDGPRGGQPPPSGFVDGQANLLLLCQEFEDDDALMVDVRDNSDEAHGDEM